MNKLFFICLIILLNSNNIYASETDSLDNSDSDVKYVRSTYQTHSQQFKCTKCDAKFNRKSNLTRHLQIHLGIKKHKCHRCGKRFQEKHHLKSHIYSINCEATMNLIKKQSKEACKELSVDEEIQVKQVENSSSDKTVEHIQKSNTQSENAALLLWLWHMNNVKNRCQS